MVSLFACVPVAGAQSFARVVRRAVIVSPSKRHFLFGSERRLHRPEEFSLVFSSRLMVRDGRDMPFVLHYRLSGNGGPSRLGIVVPKRYAKAASLRNAIKRQGREAFRLLADEIPPCDLVLRLNRSLGEVKSRDRFKRKEWRIMMDALSKRAVTVLPTQ
jgi:ribonuclease P protein component